MFYWMTARDQKDVGRFCLKRRKKPLMQSVSFEEVSSCSNTGSIRDDPYWTSRKNSLELIEPSSINKVSLV